MSADKEKLDQLRHSTAHLLAAAVLELYPNAKPTIGPAIDSGFYYDFEFSKPISDEDLKKIESRMIKILPNWTEFRHKEVSEEEARSFFKDNSYKLELIDEIVDKKEKITLYTSDKFTDLCRGSHVKNPSKEIGGLKLLSLAGAYWRGDEKNKMLTRIYGTAFGTRKELEGYLVMLEEAKKRDHKKLGPELDLFVFSPLVGAGLPLFTPKGSLLRDLLDSYVWELRKARDYDRVDIPHITKKELYEKSGHWDKFKDELFRIKTREGHEFAVKPMNCPHHTQLYTRRQWSYRELPQRYASTTKVYRDEQTGELAGLSRVRSITQDDAHVFCRHSQIEEEFLKIWDIITDFYESFGFELQVRLSLHDPKQSEKYLGDKKTWETAETILRKIAKVKKIIPFEAVGEAAFYGPKVDFVAKDSLGRELQVATIQLDMNMPERFDLICVDEKGNKERIVMIHAAIMGSIERFLAALIEHLAGAFPVWLAPVQVRILAVSDKFQKYAEEIWKELRANKIRVELTEANETLSKRIREGEVEKIPYLIVVGEKEKENGTINIRQRVSTRVSAKTTNAKHQKEMKLKDFIAQIAKEIEAKLL